MLLSIVKQFKWVDVLVVILLFRIGYIAMKNGLPVEIFKLLGIILATYLALHYYTALSDWIRAYVDKEEKMPLQFLDFLVFLALTILGYLIFVLLRSTFYRFIKMEAAPRLRKWGGLVLGIARGILLASLIVFMLVISSISYLRDSAKNSYSGKQLFKLTTSTYTWLWNAVTSKFMSGEKFNKTILEVQEDLAWQ